ncbi:DUF1641 domain-containing protein [Thermoproteus tenax]|uniref:DUF1641 domain-containing protein n=1 Tax=Thermoproteus tenax (strain ATCC 35583 / DSM 2078 / JCM 9277 / NBRC 100435 / Kra 1) TaxID=768679 RepID=G4RJT8_THETK|nr:DUF1641 domain-containing protein [Thermoproteus tenax]CCC81833.1 hypothetical protein TTX_1193 [Thermoproteus tenax Kra 1]
MTAPQRDAEIRRRWHATEEIKGAVPPISQEEVDARAKAALEFLVRSGTLDTLVELAATIKMLHDIVTDEIVEEIGRAVRLLGTALDTLTRSQHLMALVNAIADPEIERGMKKRVGISDILGLLRDEDTRRGIYYLLLIARAVGKEVRNLAEP